MKPAGLLLALSLFLTSPVFAQGAHIPEEDNHIQFLDPFLKKRVETLERRSPTFRAAMDSLRATKLPVIVGVYHQVEQEFPKLRDVDLSPGTMGYTYYQRDVNEEVYAAVVAIDMKKISGMRVREGYVGKLYEALLDKILTHEIYGHLVPVATAGSMAGRCSDNLYEVGYRTTSCVREREETIRKELGYSSWDF